ncbi:unnamed protein product [Echinostoma caproni]|uniref:SCP domain-containing protein n=1 Tax=Echinostoma caproni TaxID=27848 RepID=A0A183AEZ8_9TREM|nr:unnamed protein product [Echinostoma caproni]
MQLFISFLAICLYTTTTAAISAEHKTLLLLLHNTFREKILNCTVPGQPPAAQMPKMTWNDQLAEKAQTWSDKCKVGHDRNQDSGFYAWFDEHKNYDYANNNCTKVCGHYTQVSYECMWIK